MSQSPSVTALNPARMYELDEIARRSVETSNHGTAQTLIQVVMEFEAYGRFAGTSAESKLEAIADMITSTYEITYTDPTRCISMPTQGYNYTCVTATIADAVQEAMAKPSTGSDCATKGYSSDECYFEAIQAAVNAWDDVVGCGPSGAKIYGTGCADPNFDAPTGPYFINITNSSITERKSAIAASLATDDDDGLPIPLLYMVAAGAGFILLCIIIIAVIMLRSPSEKSDKNRDTATASFENPMYEQTNAGGFDLTGSGYPGNDAGADGLYDEPEVQQTNPTYASQDNVADATEAGGYLDLAPDDDDDDDGVEDDDDDDDEDDEEESEDDE